MWPDGSVLVGDYKYHTRCSVSAAGGVSTLAGAAWQHGSADGLGAAVRLRHPCEVVLRSDGRLFVSDAGIHTICSVSAEGEVSTVAGAAEQWCSTDGSAALARFHHSCGLALGLDCSLYIAGTDNHSILCLRPEGTVRTEAEAAAARFMSSAAWQQPQMGACVWQKHSVNHTIRCISAVSICWRCCLWPSCHASPHGVPAGLLG